MRKVIQGFGLVGVLAITLSVMLNAAAAPVADARLRGHGYQTATAGLAIATKGAPVAAAAARRDTEAVRALIKDGADVNAAQGDGMTALHWAARNGDAAMTQMLLFAGANVKASTRLGGYTPLLMAAEQGHAAVIAALLTGGADAKYGNALGTTALMLAAASGNATAVTTLVENGAEIEAREKTFGQTPLMFATANNRVDAIKALIKAGADLKATSKVVNVGSLSSREQEFLAQASGSGAQPGGGGQGRTGQVVASGAAAAPAPAARGGGRRGGGGQPGIDRPYFYNELIGTQGGVTALMLAARCGYADAVK
ncbi:MAG: ankyrin repeat domain-containing protein, partial [Vicinamibacterales bacterium]